MLGEHRDEPGEHLAHDVLGSLALDGLDAADERIVGVGQQVRGELREVAVVAVEDRPLQAGLGHERVDGEVGERALDEQAAGRGEDPVAGLGGGDARAAGRS